MNKSARLVVILLALSLSAIPVWPQQENVDLEMVTKIRYEGFRNSKIMQLSSGLMDGIGPRLTGSPNMKRANEWTRDQLASFGLVNARLEQWGPFGRGWAQEYVNVRMVSPDVAPLIAYAQAWTPGTNGVITGKCVRVNITEKKDFDKYRG
jgi:carboxypeptidase Q